MFAVSASRTMANAKPKFRDREPSDPARVLNLVAEREKREHETRMARIEAMNAEIRAQVEAERLIALEKANAILAELRVENRRYRHTVREIERRSCRLFNLTPTELHSNRRNRRIVIARQFVMYWAARLTTLSLPQIGRLMGGRDHTTVLHGREKHRERRAAMGRHLRPVR